MNSNSQDDGIERSLLRLLNPKRVACEERIEREHVNAMRSDISKLPLPEEAVDVLSRQLDSIVPNILADPRDVVREFAEREGEEVLFAMTYAELDREEPLLRAHRSCVIITLLFFWKTKVLEGGADVLAARLEEAISAVSTPEYWH